MQASGELAMVDLQDLYAKELSKVRLLPFRGGGGDSTNRDELTQVRPSVSLSTAWSSDRLPAPSTTATEAAIESVRRYAIERTQAFESNVPALALATIWAVWNILNGFLLALTPKRTSDLASFLVEHTGAIRIGQGMGIFMATSAGISPAKAIGIGLLTRLTFLAKSLIAGTCGAHDLPRGPIFLSGIVLIGTIVSTLSGKGRPMLTANFYSTTTAIEGLFLLFYPMLASESMFGFDVASEIAPRVLARCRSLGFHLLISSVFINALSLGVDPIRATGCSSLAWLALLVELTFLTGKHGLGSIPNDYLFFLSSALVCTIVFFRNGSRTKSAGLSRADFASASHGMMWQHENVALQFDEDNAQC